jgi:hypothetical protein
MLRAIISPELANSLTEDDILKFNPDYGQLFIDTVDYRRLGGYALSVQGDRRDEAFTFYNARGQRNIWETATTLNLAFDRLAVVGTPTYHLWSHPDEIPVDEVAAQLDAFIRQTLEVPDSVMGSEKFLLPLGGVILEEGSVVDHQWQATSSTRVTV